MLTAGKGGLYLDPIEVLNHGNLNNHGLLCNLLFIVGVLSSVHHVVGPEDHNPKVGLLPGFDGILTRSD